MVRPLQGRGRMKRMIPWVSPTAIQVAPLRGEYLHSHHAGLGRESERDEIALASLPHGPEFRFLDRLLSLEPGVAGAGEYAVRGDESFLKGHFPGQPLFPGVLLVEAAAQLAGVVAQSDPRIGPLPGLKLTALRAVKILGSAKPGEVIHLEAQITGRLGNLIQARATAMVNGRPLLQTRLDIKRRGRTCTTNFSISLAWAVAIRPRTGDVVPPDPPQAGH